MKLKNLTLREKPLVDSHLAYTTRCLAVYSFAQIYIWKNLYSIYYRLLDNCLCVFFADSTGLFMNWEPLGRKVSARVLDEAFAVMDKRNKNKQYSRIENIEESRIQFYSSLGYEVVAKGPDYLYNRISLARLAGDRYKSKRSICNYFEKHYRCDYKPYDLAFAPECLKLYDAWSQSRAKNNPDFVFRGMLGDTKLCLEIALKEYSKLGLMGSVVFVEKQLVAFTFGHALSKDTFCILFEIGDLFYKGASQYIFRQFCNELAQYHYINAMDDSGLDNLKKLKKSYHPARLVPAYIVQRKHA
jgi:hypothetical protein